MGVFNGQIFHGNYSLDNSCREWFQIKTDLICHSLTSLTIVVMHFVPGPFGITNDGGIINETNKFNHPVQCKYLHIILGHYKMSFFHQ